MTTTQQNGVPITKEILTNSGFKEYYDWPNGPTGIFDLMPLEDRFSYSLHTQQVMIMTKGMSVSVWLDAKYEYVHELQELYRALFKKELMFNLCLNPTHKD